MIDAYREELSAHGVGGYTRGHAEHDRRLGALYFAWLMLFATGFMVTTDRGQEMASIGLRRVGSLSRRLDLPAFIREL